MFIFGFFKWIIIGIIAFIIVIMSSIRTSDWNFTKDEIINAYNTFLQNFCVAALYFFENYICRKRSKK